LNPEPSYAGAAETYAVVDIGGHQLIVEEGRWYTVNRLEVRRNSDYKILISRISMIRKADQNFAASNLTLFFLSIN
jgi:ribosomal protein L21